MSVESKWRPAVHTHVSAERQRSTVKILKMNKPISNKPRCGEMNEATIMHVRVLGNIGFSKKKYLDLLSDDKEGKII